jgi:hypothetical protein
MATWFQIMQQAIAEAEDRLDELLPWNWKTPAVAIAAQAA